MNSAWYPVSSGADLVSRHVFHTALDGQELALWRDDAGLANVWENRCPHRGVRLTIGANLGTELRCQYHGWRFSSGSGQCASIPAHPGFVPSQGLKVKTYPCLERYGLVWTSLGEAEADIPDLGATPWQPLRALFVEAPLAAVSAQLTEQDGLMLFLQPVSPSQTVIHGLSANLSVTLRQQDEALTHLRDRIESLAP
jgi:phenylpropionate dioxygenase-like ring-hydroxylating dioxygenase large terminal subunit